MFPNSESPSYTTPENPSIGGTKTYLFDFDKDDFVIRDGKLVECDGIEAIRIWIEKIIRTEKYRYLIYEGTEYGCHLEDLIIGNNYTTEFIQAELKREIEEALLLNPHIKKINNFQITRGSNSLTISLEVYMGDSGSNTVTTTISNQ